MVLDVVFDIKIIKFHWKGAEIGMVRFPADAGMVRLREIIKQPPGAHQDPGPTGLKGAYIYGLSLRFPLPVGPGFRGVRVGREPPSAYVDIYWCRHL